MNLNESQFQRLKGAFPTYEFFRLTQSLAGDAPTRTNLQAMVSVYKELLPNSTVDLSCPSCIADLIKTVYDKTNFKALDITPTVLPSTTTTRPRKAAEEAKSKTADKTPQTKAPR